MFATHLTFGAPAPEVIPGGGRLRPELSLEQGPLAGTIEHARCELGEGADSACGTTDERVAYRMRCCVKDHLGDVLRRVHGRPGLRLSASVISYVLSIWIIAGTSVGSPSRAVAACSDNSFSDCMNKARDSAKQAITIPSNAPQQHS